MDECRPDEEGIETLLYSRRRSDIRDECRPDEEGIETSTCCAIQHICGTNADLTKKRLRPNFFSISAPSADECRPDEEGIETGADVG